MPMLWWFCYVDGRPPGQKAGSIRVRDPNGFLIEFIQRP